MMDSVDKPTYGEVLASNAQLVRENTRLKQTIISMGRCAALDNKDARNSGMIDGAILTVIIGVLVAAVVWVCVI